MNSKVPQDTVVCPTLCNIFLNSMPSSHNALLTPQGDAKAVICKQSSSQNSHQLLQRAFPAKMHFNSLQIDINKLHRKVTGGHNLISNHIIRNDFKFKTLSDIVKHLSIRFYSTISHLNNKIIAVLPEYESLLYENGKRPRATLTLKFTHLQIYSSVACVLCTVFQLKRSKFVLVLAFYFYFYAFT